MLSHNDTIFGLRSSIATMAGGWEPSVGDHNTLEIQRFGVKLLAPLAQAALSKFLERFNFRGLHGVSATGCGTQKIHGEPYGIPTKVPMVSYCVYFWDLNSFSGETGKLTPGPMGVTLKGYLQWHVGIARHPEDDHFLGKSKSEGRVPPWMTILMELLFEMVYWSGCDQR